MSRWPTPRRLRLYLALIVALALGLLLVGESALVATRRAVRVIATDTGPGILAAQEIRATLADVDAAAAQSFLARGDADVPLQLFELRRTQATRRVLDASALVQQDVREKTALLLVLDGFSRYLVALTETRVRHANGDATWVRGYRAASDLLRRRVLPEADALDEASSANMARAYDEQRRTSVTAEVFALVVGAALTAVLLSAQIFLARRMRRTFNLPLLGATLLSLVAMALLLARFDSARADLRAAKSDAFDSMHALWRIRATARDAHGEILRAQIEREQAPSHLAAFAVKVATLTAKPEAPDVWDSQLLFGQVADNAKSEADRTALSQMRSSFARYHASVGLLERERDPSGVLRGRVELEQAFDDFDASVQHALTFHRDSFDRVLSEADLGLVQAEVLDPLLAALIALLGWLGLRPRLREYA